MITQCGKILGDWQTGLLHGKGSGKLVLNVQAEGYFKKNLDSFMQIVTMSYIIPYQAIPGNDQNARPTNHKTAGSKLERTS